MANLPAEMTVAQYATHRRRTKNAVYRALRDGRIRAARVAGRSRMLDPVECDTNWGRPLKLPRTWELEALEPPPAPAAPPAPDPDALELDGDDSLPDGPVTAEQLQLWRAIKERELAIKHRRDNRQQQGDLIEVSVATRDRYETLSAVKKQVLAVPGEVATELCGITDPRVMELKLARHLRSALSDVSELLEALADQVDQTVDNTEAA